METYPTGSRDSLILAIIVSVLALAIYLYHEKSRGNLQKRFKQWSEEIISARAIVKSGLLVAVFIAIWLATRTTGLVLYSLLDENFNYSVLNVLQVLAAVLFINLCLTLIKSTGVKEIIEAAIQSVIISLLLFLPFATGISNSASAYYSAGFVLVALSVSLVAIVYTREHYHEEQPQKT
jgi:hypothetical protein